jgi:F-type H+-transporting ATPase subunit delta
MGMQNTVLNKRYAKALLGLAEENNILERSYDDLRHVHAVFMAHNELKVIMKSPVIRVAKKQAVLNHLFGNHVHPLLMAYMLIIVRKQRGHMIDGISNAYLRVYKHYLGIETVKITTAAPLDDALRQKALQAARELTPHEIEFEEEVDPDIIGGFVLDLDDQQYNASVQYRLVRIKKHLMNH